MAAVSDTLQKHLVAAKADLEAKRDAIDKEIHAVEALLKGELVSS
jgi:hypothetical protein